MHYCHFGMLTNVINVSYFLVMKISHQLNELTCILRQCEDMKDLRRGCDAMLKEDTHSVKNDKQRCAALPILILELSRNHFISGLYFIYPVLRY